MIKEKRKETLEDGLIQMTNDQLYLVLMGMFQTPN